MGIYLFYELTHAALSPARATMDATKLFFKNPLNPLSHTAMGKQLAAGAEMFERMTRRYGKPSFEIESVPVNGVPTPVTEKIVWKQPFANLIHFDKGKVGADQPTLLIVAPMSGHYATLLSGTVETMLENHNVYITDWMDARMVPLSEGKFDLDDFIDYLINMIRFLGEDVHIMAVCQPSVPVMAAASVMARKNDPYAPASMTLMGGPIDTRENPTEVNKMAKQRGIEWFKRNAIMTVPFPQPGMMRTVYPGFLQLGGFMSMNLDRHISAHKNLFNHLVEGDGDSAEKHKTFYNEYLAVMDLTSEFYLQTVDTVFIKHSLPKGEMTHNDITINMADITKTALMTVEGENDDISGVGQTQAAHKLCTGIPNDKKVHWLQPNVGHYGVFNGSRFRSEIAPRISDFIANIVEDSAKAGAHAKKPVAKPDPVKAAPKQEAKTVAKAANTNKKPAPATETDLFLSAPKGTADDLTTIKGVGPVLAKKLNDLGIYHFWQVAQMKDDAVAQIEEKLSFKGRIERDDWIAQAKALSA